MLPVGYVTNNTDCNDNPSGGAAIHPGVPDLCNLIDDNCNAVIDENALFPTITPSGNVGMCTNGSILLTANAGAGITYQWLKNDKNIGGATNQTYLAKVAGTFRLRDPIHSVALPHPLVRLLSYGHCRLPPSHHWAT